jgi:hypothetical protein
MGSKTARPAAQIVRRPRGNSTQRYTGVRGAEAPTRATEVVPTVGTDRAGTDVM